MPHSLSSVFCVAELKCWSPIFPKKLGFSENLTLFTELLELNESFFKFQLFSIFLRAFHLFSQKREKARETWRLSCRPSLPQTMTRRVKLKQLRLSSRAPARSSSTCSSFSSRRSLGHHGGGGGGNLKRIYSKLQASSISADNVERRREQEQDKERERESSNVKNVSSQLVWNTAHGLQKSFYEEDLRVAKHIRRILRTFKAHKLGKGQ